MKIKLYLLGGSYVAIQVLNNLSGALHVGMTSDQYLQLGLSSAMAGLIALHAFVQDPNRFTGPNDNPPATPVQSAGISK